eukprot:GGOE01020211.1.p1 GENE.GGOE01020211.1~~GGOE01020211.1.p1  ORF type:complete len:661 (+),score=170.64 GGOE01020211.1:93-1985(+)
MTERGRSDATGLRRKGLGFHQTWVPVLRSGQCEIQRLSRLALVERHRHPYRYRMLQDGEPVALFDSKEHMQESLRTVNMPLRLQNHSDAAVLLQSLSLEYNSEDEPPTPQGAERLTQRRRVFSHNPAHSQRGPNIRAPRPSESPRTPSHNATVRSADSAPAASDTISRARSVSMVRFMLPTNGTSEMSSSTARSHSSSSPPLSTRGSRLQESTSSTASISPLFSPVHSRSPMEGRSISPSMPVPLPVSLPAGPVPLSNRRARDQANYEEQLLSPGAVADARNSRPASSKPGSASSEGTPSISITMSTSSSSSRRNSAEAMMALASPTSSTPTERVTAWYYTDEGGTWRAEDLIVRMASTPFARGAMREAFHMVVCRADGRAEAFVAKRLHKEAEAQVFKVRESEYGDLTPDSIIKKDWARQVLARKGTRMERQVLESCVSEHMAFELHEFLLWFRRLRLSRMDCEMQGFCRTFAAEFNKKGPPKPISFLEAFLVICPGRTNAPVFSCEPLIEGKYVKHNNNSGLLLDRQKERNTPQAFSHFSYVHSNQQYVIIDIQGVGDTYTDPQVHSVDCKGFGLGNLGQKGIDAFLASHRCNNVCVGLGLSPVSSRCDVAGTSFRELAGEHLVDNLD